MKAFSLRSAAIHVLLALAATPCLHAQTTLWTQTISDAGYGATRAVVKLPGGDYISASKVTASGNLGNLRVIRHAAATGTPVWTTTLDKGRSDDLNDILVDPTTGDIFLALRASANPVSTSTFHLNWFVTRLNASTGAETWTYTYNGSATADGNDEVFSIAVAADGNIVAVGNAEGGVRARAAKINVSSGAEIWAFMASDNTTLRQFNTVACDTSGNTYAVGIYTNDRIYVVKFPANSGTPTWSIFYQGPAVLFASPTDVVIDSTGQPIICGNVRPAGATTQDLLTLKLNASTGATTWASIIPGTATAATDTLATLKVDATNDVYVAGFIRNTVSAATVRSAYAAKLSGTDGSVLWTHTKNGTGTPGANSADRYFSLQLANSSVYLSGTIQNTSTDLLATRLDAATGAQTWTLNYDVASAAESTFGSRRGLVLSGADSVVLAGDTAGTTGFLVNINPFAGDTTPPTVTSIVRRLPSTAQATTSTSATFRVTFSEPVNTPATSNFAVAAVNSSTITGTISSVTPVSTSIYDVAVTITSGTGEFRLLVKD